MNAGAIIPQGTELYEQMKGSPLGIPTACGIKNGKMCFKFNPKGRKPHFVTVPAENWKEGLMEIYQQAPGA